MSRVIGICVLVASLVGGWLWMDYRGAIDAPLRNSQPVYFEVLKGQGLGSIALALRQHGIIHKAYWFKLLAYRERVATKLKYGEYEIPPHATMRDLLALLVSGKQRQYSVTFIEGWQFRQILQALGEHEAITHQMLGKSPDEVMALLGAPGENAEGRFFPDTYFFTKGTADVDLLRRAYGKMQVVLDREWQSRAGNIPLISPYQALILASIIEKESALPQERPQIAGVFARRLQKGMLLQTDPTVIYGLGEAYDGDIRREDLTRDTPYNTYVRAGLPPTPIAMPGVEAIHAAVHPAEGDSLYFVARGDGSHVFSSTLDEHNHAVELFQKPHHD